MSIEDTIVPTTLVGIKKLATKISKSQSIQHVRALDVASVKAGFHNFEHARNSLSSTERTPALFKLFITAYWIDRDSLDSGRETIEVWIKKPLKELLSNYQRSMMNALRPFKLSGHDHLVSKDPYLSQRGARRAVCFAARQIQFVDTTNLKPSYRHLSWPNDDSNNSVPKHDHVTTWCDSEGRQLYVDEPYGVSINDPERRAWSERFGQRIALTNWAGMYYPGGSKMFLISDNEIGVQLDPLLAILDALPYPVNEEDWKGESAGYHPTFISPGRRDQIELRKQQPTKKISVPRGERKTIPYIAAFVGKRSKPMGRMSIKDHGDIGKKLVSVLADTFYRPSVYNRIDSIRSVLEDWVQKEYTSLELSNEDFFALYYSEYKSTFQRKLERKSINAHIKALNKMKVKLSATYPDCKPLRAIVKKIDTAIQSLDKWS